MKPDETGIAASNPRINPAYGSKPSPLPLEQRGHSKSRPSYEKGSEPGVMPPSNERIMYSKVQGANSAVYEIIQGIRTVDETMQQIGHHLNGMKHAVETILKNYPPFPVDNHDRVTQLRQFSALRKMIDQLTLPPKEDDSPAVILGDHQKHATAGDWEYLPAVGMQKLVVRHQPVHSGEQGLDLPDLAVDASDEDLADAMERLSLASERLAGRRKQFVADANRVIASMG